MANSIQSPRQRLSNTEDPYVPTIGNTIFIWLDKCHADFEKFRKQFCENTPAEPKQWLFFEKPADCYHFIENSVLPSKKVILVTSGSLGHELIGDLHHCEQLDSVYIYCQKVEKYKEFSRPYKKVLGVYSNPVELFSQLRHNLDKRAAETPTSTSNSFFTNNDNIERFSQPDLPWNPWNMNTCTKTLPVKGHSTVAVIQTGSIRFEIILSTAKKFSDINNENNYSIILVVNSIEVTLGTCMNNRRHLIDRTNETHQILQANKSDNREYTYWISFSQDNLTVMYGLGEIRPKFKVFERNLDPKHLQFISNITYLHVKIEDVHENFDTISYLKDKIRFLIGSLPFHEPSLFVLRQSQVSLVNQNISGISPLNLIEPCRSLYHSLIHFKLDDEDFPDLIQAIEYSIKNPQGWCYQKLLEKANRFGRFQRERTYLRLTLDSNIIEIFPPGHSSPVHNHKKAYGMFRVLHGCILLRLFPALALNLQHEALIEDLLRQDQVTWMLPQLNQTHQMKNVESSSSCILIQCYEYGENDEKRSHEEILDYIDNSGKSIQTMKPNSDMNFGTFKERIKKEWDERST